MQDLLIDRLRAQVRAAGIPAGDEDLDRIRASGYLEWAEQVEGALRAVDVDDEILPDTLAPPTAPGASSNEAGGAFGAGRGAPERPRVGAPPPPHRTLPAGVGTVADLAAALRAGSVSSVELAAAALRAIEDCDPELNAFQSVLAEEALRSAREADRDLRSGRDRGALHGIPVAVKDLFAMVGTETTAGSRIFSGRVSEEDAGAVERLRAAGAVIVGKTRMAEFAFWPGSANPHFGPTRNPLRPDRDTGGSSSGSAAAVAAGILPAALGTDTGGSVRIPAALCGLVGLKPTFGRITLHGCFPLSWSLDHVGSVTRTVDDAALVLGALSGPDRRDPRSLGAPEFRPVAPPPVGRRLRVGVMGEEDGSGVPLGSSEVLTAWRESNEALVRSGAELVEVDLSAMTALRAASSVILATEAASLHHTRLRERFAEIGPICRDRLVGAFAFGPEVPVLAQRVRHLVRARWSALWEEVDVLSLPCQPAVAPTLGDPGSTRLTNPFNALGWPAISVPFGVGSEGLPCGTQLVARPWDEAGLLEVARRLEEWAHGS